jgi:uncharacterized protein YwlG (UPF0340 family)
MKDQGKDFNQLLAKLEDKEEWEVKIYVALDRMKDWVFEANPGTKGEELVPEELNKKLNEYIQKSFGWMKKQACEAKSNRIFLKVSDQKKKKMVLDSVYLVPKEHRENFIRVLRFLEEEYKDKGLEFEWTGPKLLYNFLSVK